VAESRTAVVCDTTTYLPREVIEENELTEVSLYVSLDGRQERESDIVDLAEFYDRLRASAESVSTSQPSVGDFVSAYEPLLAEGREIVSVHISGAISGTVKAAEQARDRLIADGKGGERVTVFDSRTGAGGQAIVTLAGAHAAAQGATPDAIVERMEKARAGWKMWFAVDTLEFLRRGGRIGAARALLGSTLKIKPILTLEEEITPVERVRTRRRAFERLIEYARERHSDGADAWVVQHVQDPEAARHLVEECRQIFDDEPVFVSEIGPVLGAHVGPGLLGVGAVPPSVLDGSAG
jgi:DegV family protein with EDD domain